MSTEEFVTEVNSLLPSDVSSPAVIVESVPEQSITPVISSPNSSIISSVSASPSSTPKSRKRSQIIELLSPSKRMKHVDGIDADIERHKKGVYL